MTTRDGSELELSFRLPLSDFVLELDQVVPVRVVGVFGPSGAGKSSVLEAIAGLRRDVSGRIRFGDQVWTDTDRGVCVPAEARGVGLVPQAPLLFPHLSVRQNLTFGERRAKSLASPTALESVADMLEISALMGREPGELSGGEQKRVALGRALCSAPRLLLLDEPFAGLDLKLRQKLRGLLLRVRDQVRVPMLLVSHEPADVQALCDTTLVLDRGRVIRHGAPARVFSDPEVLPLGGSSGFENVLEARILGHEGDVTRVLAGESGGPELIVPRCPAEVGQTAVLSLRAQDVLVATVEPRGLSARNILEGIIVELSAAEGGVAVRVQLGADTELLAELTDSTRRSLELELNKRVYLVVKTRSFSVLA
jgi:molybdate transport system ATP-binding protein